MASADEGSSSRSVHHEATECSSGPAFQEAQKWIEAVTGRTFGEKDFRSSLENGILLCELLSSIKPGLVKKINRLPTPIAGLDNLTVFLRGCEELGLKGSQLFDPGDLQDMSIRANLTGSDCSRKLKNVLITIYWLGKTVNGCASYCGPTLDLKEFEGLLSMMRKECVNEEPDSPKRSVRDSGCVDNWESELSDSLSPPRHRREDSFDSLDSFSSQSQPTPSPDTVLRPNCDDLEGDHRKLPDVLKDDMSARRVSYKEPRAALPFNQYLPNKSNQSTFMPAQLKKRRSEREEERRSGSNSTSPIREECVGISSEMPLALHSQKTVTWAVEGEAEPQLDEVEFKKMRKLEKAGIKVLPASARYSSPKVTAVEPEQAKSPSPDIIRRCDNSFLRGEQTHEWDEDDDDDDDEGEERDRKVPDIQKDDLASRRARMNRPKPSVAHQFLPSSCSSKDRERWEGIRLSSQHAVLEMLEKMEQEKKSESDTTSTEVPIVTRKDNPFLSPHGKQKAQEEESDEEDKGRSVVPNVQKDDLARRRTRIGSLPQKGPRQSLAQTSITQSDLEKWQRLSMTIENSEAAPVAVSIITRKENPFLSPEKAREKENDEDDERETEGGGQAVLPNIQKDDLARRRGQTGALPLRDHQRSLAQTSMTQSDLEKWQRLQMSTENSDSPPLCQSCLAASSVKVAHSDPARCQGRSRGDRKHVVTFGGVTKMESFSWEEERQEEEWRKEGGKDESEMLRRLFSSATVAMPTAGMSSGQERAGGSSTPTSPLKSAQPFISDPKHSLTLAEREDLELRLAEKVRDEKEYEEEEEEEEKERQPDVKKDDMMARRTGQFQKASGKVYYQFLPLPGSKKETCPADSVQKESKSASRDPLLDRNIKTKRFKMGQRVEQVKPESNAPSPAAQKETEVLGSTSTRAEVHCGSFTYPVYDEEYNDRSPLPNPEKDDMLARRTGSYQNASGNQFNAFLPKPGGVDGKKKSLSGQYRSNVKTSGQEKKNTQESNHGYNLNPTPRSVTPPPADVDDIPRKCPQILDGEKADTVGMMGGEIDVVGGAQAQRPLLLSDPDARHTFCLDDDVFPVTFSHKASSVSDETESISLTDMRDEEEDVDSLSPHSQTRHERLHNQYNKLKEEEDQWQDDLARWKNRRRSASQDLIRKEEERKMIEKLMTSEGRSHRKKSIKTYKEIVEEKERREQELHELYCQASTPEEKAAILQRYALRFTISDAILEKLQLPKLPSVATLQSAYALNEEAERPESQTFAEIETDSSDQYFKQTTHPIMHSHLNTPDLSPIEDSRTPDVPLYSQIPLSVVRDSKTAEVQLSPVRDSKSPAVQHSPVRDSKSPAVQLSPVRDAKSPAVQHSPVRDSKSPAVQLSPVRDAKSLAVQLSPVRDSKSSEVQLSLVQVSKSPEVQLSPVRDSKSSEVQLSPVRDSKSSEVQLSPVRDSKSSEVQLSPVRDSKSPEVQLSPVQDSKSPEIQLSPVRDSKSPEVQLSPVRDSKIPDVSLSPSLDFKTLEAPLSQIRTTKTPEFPLSPVRIPPAPSRPVPLLTPKPYSQPKFNQPSYKQVKNDGLVRVNGDSVVEDTRESPVRPVSFTPTPPKPSPCPQRSSEISAGSETTAQECTRTLPVQKSEHVKEENDSHSSPVTKSTEDKTSKTPTDSELTGKQTIPAPAVKLNCVVKTTIVTELRETHSLPTTDAPIADQMSCSDGLDQKSDEISFSESRNADVTSYSLTLSDGFDFTSECIETPILNLAKRVNHWTWDPNEERKRQERWQQEQERLLQEKYEQEQQRLKQEWEKAQREVEEEERRHHEEERRILEETVAPLTPHSSSGVTEAPPASTTPHDTIVLSLADWERKQEMLEKEAKMNQRNGLEHRSDRTEAVSPPQQNDQGAELQESQSATPQLQFIQDGSWRCKSESRQEWKKTASLDRNVSPSQSQPPRMRRSVSAKKLCSSCAQPLGKGAAMIIDTLGLYFHIQCFKCGVCKGLLGDTSTGTDVRIRNGVLNCHSCYMKSRAAGQPTML
ncbi:LIM and calponin homology domains-containing protein 1a isoform X3 [Ictalurus punctatus]|uniref:LIM and calponin homology domains-containing protein 1a isoform X3 n=1 Tax=Ictalurus punctatus TaxID=7998 RepID=A0A9F7R0C1_ICTPU|nr:LIM and calponin homology domains-containing protein 1a isoform X3 [Ictalurus punctatus]